MDFARTFGSVRVRAGATVAGEDGKIEIARSVAGPGARAVLERGHLDMKNVEKMEVLRSSVTLDTVDAMSGKDSTMIQG